MTMTTPMRIWLCALLTAAFVWGRPTPSPAEEASAVQGATGAVHDAIVAAVRARMGDVQVRVADLRTSLTEAPGRPAGGTGLVAVPDPGARTGRSVQFTLRAGKRRAGSAVATVDVSAPHVRAARAFARDERLAAEALVAEDGAVVDVRFERLPGLDELVDTQARRAVAPREVMTTAVVAVPDVVRSGDEVQVVVRMGPIEATGLGRASGSGRVGDVIRVGRAGTRTLQRARIVAPGTVEILP
jgi:flagella basal body P-ring formation protein FlgA